MSTTFGRIFRSDDTFDEGVGTYRHYRAMWEPFVGSAEVAAGRLTKYTLRSSRFVAVHHDIYVVRGTRPTAVLRAKAAWLWSRTRGVVPGQSAAVLHGAKWVSDQAPAELLYDCRRPPNIRTWSDRVEADEIELIAGMRVTTPARTALDLACRYPFDKAVAAIDALARATSLKTADVELLAARYRGRRNIRRARAVLALIDAGAESPRETWLRLLLIRAGFPPPHTQIPVYDGYGQLVAVVDMGWEEIQVAADYDGDHHRSDPVRFARDIHRFEAVTELGWIDVRVTKADTEGGIISRVQAAWDRRACNQREFSANFSR